MKSILFINYEYPPVGGGASNANYNIAVNMARMGVRYKRADISIQIKTRAIC